MRSGNIAPMRKAISFLAVLSGLVVAGAAHGQASTSTGKQTYKWVDEKGVTHYGDHVPAEYSQREQRVLNEQGLEVQKRQAELSPAEATERAKKQKEEAQRKQHDMFLLSTYPSTREIESVRDTRLDQINGQISAAEAYIATLNTRVDGLKQRSQMFAPYNRNPGARRIPDDLAEEMVRALSELRTQNSALANRRSEAKAVTEQFDGDIRRFKELRMSAAARVNDASQPKKQ
jgi:GAF domain-containing protein